MYRQLRASGGIMQLQPRQQYFLGGITKSVKKAVKGVTGAVKDFAKSDLGKAALMAAGAYYAPTMFGGTAGFGAGSTYGNFAKGLMSPNLIGPMTKAGSIGRGISSAVTGGGLLGNVGTAATILGGGVLGSLFGSPQEAQQAFAKDPQGVKNYLVQYFKNLNKEATDEEAAQFAEEQTREYAANGGRIGYADGTPEEEMMSSNPGAAESGNPINTDNPIANLIDKYNTYKKAIPGVADETKTYLIEDFKKSLEDSGISIEEFNMRLQEQNEMDEPVDMAYGGRMGYAFGTDPVEKAGIMGLPVRQNQQGVKEVDLRETGGFIPPVGVKEKADDIPAMLSNNEFVFTADSVRNMGDGDVNKGAEKMYAMMKHLENGGRV